MTAREIIIKYKEKIFPSEDGEALEQAAQRGCRLCLWRYVKPDRKLKCVCELICLVLIEEVNKTAN